MLGYIYVSGVVTGMVLGWAAYAFVEALYKPPVKPPLQSGYSYGGNAWSDNLARTYSDGGHNERV